MISDKLKVLDDFNKTLFKLNSHKLVNKEVLYGNLNRNSSIIVGDKALSAQIFTDINSDVIDNAISNKFMIYNITECSIILKNYYNLTDDSIFLNSHYGEQLNTNDMNSYKLSAFSYDKRTKLNLNLCQNISIDVQMPINNKLKLNLTLYKDLIDKGIDIFNENDPAFTDRCFSYKINGTDTTVNWRRQNLLQSTAPLCIGIDCTFQSISDHNYLQCNCSGLSSDSEFLNGMVDTLIESFSQLNLGIIFCYKLISYVSLFLNSLL
jgi:hypothetical protein